MRKIAFIIFLIPFFLLNVAAQAKLTPAEYTVFASVLKGIYKENRETYANKSEFVFLNETKIDPELELPSERKYKNLVKDFNRKNKIPGILEKKFPRGAYSDAYYLVSQAEVDELLERGRIESDRRRAEVEKLNASGTANGYVMFMGTFWTPFFQKYPESSGLHILSRVGFSGRFAMVQVKADRSFTGFSRIYILKKITGKWKIISANGTEWIS
jgi:hypothetical protein